MAKEKIEFDESIHGEALRDLIKTASDNKLKVESFNDLIKRDRDAAKSELGVEPKLFNQLLSIYHKKTRERFENEKDAVVETYDTLFPEE